MGKAGEDVFRSFPETGGKRPRAGLSNHVQRTFEVKDFVIAVSVRLAKEPDADHGIGDAHPCQCYLRKPLGQKGIDEQHAQGCKRLKSKHGLKEGINSGGGPCLRRICSRINRRERMIFISRMPGNALGQSEKIEQGSQLELRTAYPLDIVVTAVAIGSDREWTMFDRPDGAAVV